MTQGPFNSRIRLLERSAYGTLTAEFGSYWTGKLVKVPRKTTSIEFLKTQSELASPGVYFLTAEKNNSAEIPDVYIGESDDLLERISQHDRGKDFWNLSYGVVSKSHAFDSELNKTNCKFLESVAISEARKNNRSIVLNKTSPPLPKVDNIARDEMQHFYSMMSETLPLLGCHILTPKEPGTDDDTPPSTPPPDSPSPPPDSPSAPKPARDEHLSDSEEEISRQKVIESLGLTKDGNKGRFSWYRAPNGELVHLKYSKYHERDRYYWYGTTPNSLENAKKFGITKFCYIQGDEGFMVVDMGTLERYVSNAGYSVHKSSGEPRHYHTCIRIYPEPILFHFGQDEGTTITMKENFTPF